MERVALPRIVVNGPSTALGRGRNAYRASGIVLLPDAVGTFRPTRDGRASRKQPVDHLMKYTRLYFVSAGGSSILPVMTTGRARGVALMHKFVARKDDVTDGLNDHRLPHSPVGASIHAC